MSLNVVAMMGRMVADPELRHTPNGIATCTFRIAVDRSFVRAGEERKADFIDIVAWRQSAEFVCKYFRKGDMIVINGSLQTRNYEDKKGNKRTAYEVVAENASFCGAKPKSSKYTQPSENGRTDENHRLVSRDDLPDGFDKIEEEEDLPF